MPLALRPQTDDRPILSDALTGLHRSLLFAGWLRVLGRVAFCFALLVWAAYIADRAVNVPPSLRALALVTLLLCGGVSLARGLRAPARRFPDRLAVALHVESFYPALQDTLSSSVEFGTQQNHLGSKQLRELLLKRADFLAEEIDWSTPVEPRHGGWYFMLMLLAGGVIALLPLTQGEWAVAAAGRWLDPYGHHDWPPRTRLRLVEPDTSSPLRVTRGDVLDVRVAIGGEIPERVRFLFQLKDGPVLEQAFPVTIVRDADGNPEGEAVWDYRIEPNRMPRDFRFRVAANDGDSGWVDARVVTPPQLVPFGGRPSPRLHADFPGYTRLAPLDFPDGSSLVDLLAGTRVTLVAATDRPIREAGIRYQPEQPAALVAAALAPLAATSNWQSLNSQTLTRDLLEEIPAAISGDDKTFSIPFIPRVGGIYRLRYSDAEGVTGQRLIDVRIQSDPSPNVTRAQPPSDTAFLRLLPTAKIDLSASAQDPALALRRCWLAIDFGDTADAMPILETTLYDGAALERVGGLLVPEFTIPRRTTFQNATQLDLSILKRPDGTALKPGDRLRVAFRADDFDDVTGMKRPGHAEDLVIEILSGGQLDSQTQEALANARDELKKAKKQQAEIRERLDKLKTEAKEKPPAKVQEELRLLEAAQGEFRNKINDPKEGVRAKVREQKNSLDRNQQSTGREGERFNDLDRELDRMNRDALEKAQNALRDAKTADEKEPGKNEKAVDEAIAQQNRVEAKLEKLLRDLEPWSSAGELRGEAEQLLQELAQPNPKNIDALAEKGRQLVEKMARAASVREAQLRKLEKDPSTPPETLKDRKAELDALKKALDGDPDAKTPLAATPAEELKESLRQAAEAANEGRMGEAQQAQQQARRQLEQMTQALEDKRDTDPKEKLDRLQKKRDEVAEKVDALIRKQETLQKKVIEAQRIGDPRERREKFEQLAREQAKLADEARDLADELNRQQDRAAITLNRATEAMENAQERMKQDRAAEENQDAALDQLDQAQAEMKPPPPAKKDPEAEAERLQREKLVKLADRLKAFRDRQQGALAEGKRLTQAATAAKKWSRPQLRSLDGLAEQEQALAKELDNFAEKQMDDFPIFRRMLQQTTGSMGDLVKSLKDRRESILDQLDGLTDFQTDLEKSANDRLVVHLERSLRRLNQLIEAMKVGPEAKKSPPKAANNPPMPPAGGGATPRENPAEGITPVSQLKALRALQEQLIEETKQFDDRHPDRQKLDDDALAELKRLEATQRDVAELIRTWQEKVR